MVVKENFKSPIVFVAIFFAIFVYLKIVPVKNSDNFSSLISSSDVVSMYGKITSNPTKTATSGFYIADFAPYFVYSKNEISSSAKGSVKVFFDEKIVEANFPGKLYSSSNSKELLIFETGALLTIFGNYSDKNIFFVSSAKNLKFENSFRGKLSYIRAISRLQFRRLMYGWKWAGGLLLSLLSGAREYTEPSVSDAFKKSGLSHILALSGMHLSLVSSLALFAGMKFFSKKISYIFQLCAIIFFVWFAGFSPSLLRAFLCSIIAFVFVLFHIKVSLFFILCTSFIIHSLIFPSHLQNVAFMLSYGALAGILIFAEYINKYLVRFIPSNISQSLSASSAAQFFTAPISLSVFSTFMPIGIIATVFVSPFTTVFIYVGLALIFISLIFPPLAFFSNIIINVIYNIIKSFVLFFSKFPSINI